MNDFSTKLIPTVSDDIIFKKLTDDKSYFAIIDTIKNANDLSSKEKIVELYKARKKYNAQVQSSISVLVSIKLTVALIALGILHPKSGQLLRQGFNALVTNSERHPLYIK